GWWCFRTFIGAQGLNGVEQHTAVSDDNDAKVLGRQTRQDLLIDLVFAERRLIRDRSAHTTCPGRSHAVLSDNFRWRPICGPARARLPRAYLPPTVRRLP